MCRVCVCVCVQELKQKQRDAIQARQQQAQQAQQAQQDPGSPFTQLATQQGSMSSPLMAMYTVPEEDMVCGGGGGGEGGRFCVCVSNREA